MGSYIIKGKLKYQELKDFITTSIEKDRLQPGDAILSENALIKKCGVSQITVRRAISELVQEGLLCRMQGKGTFVKNIAEPKGHSIGIVGCAMESTFFGDDIYYGKIMEGVRQVIEGEQGIFSYQLYGDKLGYSRLFRNGNLVEGMLVFIPHLDSKKELLRYAQQQHVVVVGSTLENEPINCVDSNDVEDSYMAVKYLLDKGHRRILFVSLKQSWEISMDGKWRLQGYTRALEEKGINFRKEFSVFDDMNRVKDIFAKDNRPTAVFGAYAAPLEETVKTLLGMGLRIPQDVEVVVYDGFFDEELRRQVPHTVVYQPLQEVGELATKRLISLIEGKAQGTKQVKLKSSLRQIGY